MMANHRSTLIATAVILVAFALGFTLRRSTSDETENVPGRPQQAQTTAAASAAPSALSANLSSDPDALFQLAVEQDQANAVLDSAIAFYQWLNVADAATIAAEIVAADESTLTETHWGIAAQRWAELDRDSLIAKLGDESDWTRAAIFSADLRADAMAALESSPPEFLEQCRKYIAARHPEFDLDWARSFGVSLEWFVRIWLRRDLDPATLLPDLGDIEPEVAKIILYDAIGRRDSDRIATFLEKLGDDPELLELAHQAIGEELRSGLSKPLESLKILERFGIAYPPNTGAGPQVPLYHYHETAMGETPEATIEWLLSLDPEKRKIPLQTIFGNSRIGNMNLSGWLDLYQRVPREELPALINFSMTLKTMISQDPLASLEWFEEVKAADHFSIGDEHNHSQFLIRVQELGARLAIGGSESAIETARKIEDAELREAVLAGVVEHAGGLDTETARTVLAELGDELSEATRRTTEQTILQQEIQNEFHDAHFDVALEHLNSIDDEKVRSEIATSIINDHEVPFADRAKLLDQHPNSSALSYPSILTQGWAKKDPEAAANWVLKLADHEKFPEHVETLIKNWAPQDVNAAGTWLQQIESEPALDAAKVNIANRASSVEPHTALEWAASISDSELRAGSLRKAIIIVDTFASEAGEANKAIANLAISEAERAMLREHLAE